MAYNSYNEYVVKNNLLVLVAIIVANYFASKEFRLFSFLLSFRVIFIAEWVLGLLAVFNIGYTCRGTLMPLASSLDIPYRTDLFTPGPLVEAFMNLFKFSTLDKKKPTVAKPAPVVEPKKDDDEMRIINANKRLLSWFLTKPPQTTDPSKHAFLFNDINPKSSFNANIFQQTFLSQNNLQDKKSVEGFVAAHELQKLAGQPLSSVYNVNQSATSTIGQATQAPASILCKAPAPAIPKLRYTPCLEPPARRAVTRERLLWYLSPTPEVVEDFRLEQILQFQKYWNTFNNRAEYDKLTEILLSKIFVPLTKSIEAYDKILATKHMTVANCSPRVIALSMTWPNVGATFNLSDVSSMISLDGYPSSDTKNYVAERIKDLSSGNRMAAYRYTPKFTGMPTDAKIMFHVFKYYLSIYEPYAIPPLIPQEGDIFRFLLVYIKITPELKHWGLDK